MSRRILLLVLLWSLSSGVMAQAPRDRAQAPVVAAGQILGRVVSQGMETTPVRRARVTLSGPALQVGRTTITRDDGTFVFDALPPGKYSLAAGKSGYISMQFGASGPGRPGLPVTVAAGVRQTATIVIPRGGVVTGTITGTDGQPLAGQHVRAMRYRIVPPRGERRLLEVPGSNTVTDDRGIYRIFGLPAGTYAVSARPPASAEVFGDGLRTVSGADVRQALADVRRARVQRTPGAPAPPPSRPSAASSEPAARVAFAPVFYPGTTSGAHARLVTLGPGEERSGVDFDIDYVPVARISGSVVGTSGGATRAYVRLIADPQEALLEGGGFRGVTTEPNGAFAFDAVPPGRYVLAARASSDSSPQPRYDPATTLWASTDVVVSGQDVTGVVLAPVPGITLHGRLTFEGQRPRPQLTGLRMMAMPLSAPNSLGGNPMLAVADDGRFSIYGVPPGLYWPDFVMGLRTPIGSWWVKSMVLEGRELLDAPLDLHTTAEEAVMTFADTASQLGGRATLPSGEPAVNSMVVVFPVDPRGWFFNSRRVAAVPIDAQGRYVVRNLPPGEYHVAASATLDQFDWFDPEVLARLAPAAGTVAIRGDESVTLDLTVR